MATVSLIDPYSQQSEEIARRRRMAQALQEQHRGRSSQCDAHPYASQVRVRDQGCIRVPA